LPLVQEGKKKALRRGLFFEVDYFLAAAFLVAFLAGAFLVAFLAGAFLVAFLAGAFLVAFLAGAFLVAAFFVAFLAIISSQKFVVKYYLTFLIFSLITFFT
jgi:hypothetical protein